MNKTLSIAALCVLSLIFVSIPGYAEENKDPKKLIEKMTEVTGNYNDLISMTDVEYNYEVTNKDTGKTDVSIERYIFDGELSWAKYLQRDNDTFPDLQGEIIQGYNGKESWMTLNGNAVTDEGALKYADFLRKTNFYWFAMMQKLMDPGIIYSYKGKQNVNDIEYDIVEISYEPGIGDVSDIYQLYINPETHLVDRFLFTVMDFGITEPLLMVVEYKQFGNIKLPVNRKFTQSNLNGDIIEEIWIEEIMTDIKFNNGFKKSLFEKPTI